MQLELDRINGKRNRRFVTVKGSYKDAQKELTRLLNAVDAGSLPDVTNMTVAEYVATYLDGAHGLAPKTLERYRELAAHVDVLTVSRRLGHSKPHVTLDVYGHLIEGADAAAAKAIDEVLK
jgi:hypothetical protein